MVFSQTTFFDADIPYAFGKASQQIHGFCPDGTDDACVDYVNNKLSGVVKDNSFDIRNWSQTPGVMDIGHPSGLVTPGPHATVPGSHMVALPEANTQTAQGTMVTPPGPMPRSYIPEIVAILAIAFIAGILAYTNPKIFQNLFKIFIGYEIFVLILAVLLILIVLGVYLFKPTMF